MAEAKEQTIDLGDGVRAKIGKDYVELFSATKDFPLKMNQALRLAAPLAQKIMRN